MHSPYKKPAELIGIKRDGAEVKAYDGVFFLVLCACGTEFKVGRTRLGPSYPGKLRCRHCIKQAYSVAGTKAQKVQQAAYEESLK